jgi:hypothetical protein
VDERVAGQDIKGKSEEYSRVEAELKAKGSIDRNATFASAENYESGLQEMIRTLSRSKMTLLSRN